MKRVLIISPHFPPVNAPDLHRIRASLPAFVQAGWEVTVLTVADPTPAAPVEQELLESIPAAVRVERARCLSRSWTRWLGLGNVALRALPFLFLRGHRILSRERFDAVYFSTTQFIVLPFGRFWRKLHGVPYVIDLQDPWVTDYYERTGTKPPGGWKYRFARLLARLLEGWTMRGAAHLVTVSSRYVEMLRERYPAVRNTPFTELPFGVNEADLQLARATRDRAAPLLPAGTVRLVFAGAISPGMLPCVEACFAGLAAARQTGLVASVSFFGTSYSGAPDQKPVVLELAQRHGLADCVKETPARLGYFDALRVTVSADINLVFGSIDLSFTPSKIVTLLAAGRPILALAPAGSAMLDRLRQLGCPATEVPANGPDDATTRTVSEAILRLIRSGEIGTRQPLPPEFRSGELARRQLDIFEALAARSPAPSLS